MTITTSTYPIVYGLAADFTGAAQINAANPQLGYATDTQTWYFHTAGASTWTLVSGGGTSINQSSSGLAIAGNLNPPYTPTVNQLVAIEGEIYISSYSSGSVGFAVNYVKATAGASAVTVQKQLNPVENTIKNISKSTDNATAGAATGVYSIQRSLMFASGGKAIQPSITLTGSSKYNVYWRITAI